MNATNIDDGHPSTLSEDGRPPETRIGTAAQARYIFEQQFIADNEKRGPDRAYITGIIDGNPPYRQSDLDDAGRSHQANFNPRTAESYLENAVGAFYDADHEAPTYYIVKLKGGNPEQQVSMSRIVTEEFDWLQRHEKQLDWTSQVSKGEMVTYGTGPLVFTDIYDWRPKAILSRQLYVPEFTQSETAFWDDCACITMELSADALWRNIMDAEAAKRLGWNVARTQQAIINASPESSKGHLQRTWEWHQQQLRNGSIYYAASSKTISLVHVLGREFCKRGDSEGKITHVIIERDGPGAGGRTGDEDKFLFQSIGRFDSWDQCIHPMYYDRGRGGFHHAVVGMGRKMAANFALQTRTLCNAADKAAMPKLIYKATSQSAAEQFAMKQHGDWAIVSAEGGDIVPAPMGGFVEEAMMFHRELGNIAASNLSAYRINQAEPIKGNPKTATETEYDASAASALQKTQMTRFYEQKDALGAEMYRRAVRTPSKTSPGGARAMEFIERCERRGVPRKMLQDVEWVKCSRVVGQGSQIMRSRQLDKLFVQVGPGLPETGRTNLVNDIIAANTGQQDAVERYNPKADADTLPDDQYATAVSQIADMKIGVPAVVTATQNPVVFATTFLEAANQAVATLDQGANPQDVASFLDFVGEAVWKHIGRLQADPTRVAVVKQLTEQAKLLAQVHDRLTKQLQQQAENNQRREAEVGQQMNADQMEMAMAQRKQEFELGLKQQKTQAGIADKALKTRQSLALNDAKTAQSIRLNRLQAEHDQAMAAMQAAHSRRMAMEQEGPEEL